jgi:hypothetical protein
VRTKLAALFVLLLAAFWLSGAAHAQNSCSAGCVQWGGTGFQGSTSAPGTTVTGVTAGDTLDIYFCGLGPTALGTVTDNGTSVPVGAVQVNANAGQELCLVAVSSNTTAGSHVIVVNVTGTCSSCTTIVPEWHGVSTLTTNNGAATNTLGVISTPVTGGSVTATASARVESMYTAVSTSNGQTIPSGFTSELSNEAGISIAFEDVSAGSFNPSWTTSPSPGDGVPIVMNAIFQAGGGGGAVTHSRLTKDVGQ